MATLVLWLQKLGIVRYCVLKALVDAATNVVQRYMRHFAYCTMMQVRRIARFCIASIGAVMAYQACYAADLTRDPPGPADVPAHVADLRLPVGAPIKIVIRYSSENLPAQHRAAELARGLRGQGLDVTDPVASPERIANNTVSYFYLEDRPGAEIAARALGPAWRSVQQRLSPREMLARPGIIDLAVAGP